ncbi:MAG: hypothetical protein M3R00_04840 [Pseudomonadota bacterium]|nr:hypothetical protein [Pseudomonadota bacterium]
MKKDESPQATDLGESPKGNGVGQLVAGAAVGLVLAGAGAIFSRIWGDRTHEKNMQIWDTNFRSMDAEIREVKNAIDALKGKSNVAVADIAKYKELCNRLRNEYDFQKQQYVMLRANVVILENEVRQAEAANGANISNAC